jgi:hypothetical protein
VQFIVTSRTTLAVPGEVVLALDTLPVPEAVALFHDRAAAASKDYVAAAGDPILLQTLAASWTACRWHRAGCSPREHDDPGADTGAARSALQAARFQRQPAGAAGHVEGDAGLVMGPAGRCRARRLMQLRFSRAASPRGAEAVLDLGAHGTDLWVPDVVQSLLERSLVRAAGGARFSMLRSVQDYLRERLDPVAARSLEGRHWAYMARLDATDARPRRKATWRTRWPPAGARPPPVTAPPPCTA